MQGEFMRIGIVTAMAEETLPIVAKLGNIKSERTIAGAVVREIDYKGNTVYLAQSGVGEISAAITTQLLVTVFKADLILNFGFVGAINPDLDVSELVMVEKIAHHQFDISALEGVPAGRYTNRDGIFFYTDKTLCDTVQSALPERLRFVTDASGDKFIASKEDKEHLKNTFGADICEMECAGIAITAEKNNVPFLSIKVVSDRADEGATVSFVEVLKQGLTKYETVLPVVLDTAIKMAK